MNSGWYEVVTKRVHLDQRSHANRIAKVVGIDAFGYARASHWFGGQETRFAAIAKCFTDEGESKASIIAATTNASNDEIRVVTCLLHLKQGFLSNDGLVEQ